MTVYAVMNDDSVEVDIGLIDLSRPPQSPIAPSKPLPHASQTPPEASVNGQLKSPSSPTLLSRPFPPELGRRRVSRSNTLPRLPRGAMHRTRMSMDGLAMGPEKVAKLHRWILSLVTVDFDLEVGPKITSVYPPLRLSRIEAQNIAFSSFPDSSQFDEGSQTHSFRIRLRDPIGEDWACDAPRPITVDGFIYGFSCFTRTKDASSKRGYQQTSTVVLTHLAYPSLFYTLISKLGPSFMNHGGPMLEAACHNIASWPDPVPGTNIELGFLGTVIHAEIPNAIETQQSMSALPPGHMGESDIQMLVSVCPSEPPILHHLEAVITHLWSIWECVVLSEPLLIFGHTPVATSIVVWWLRDLLRPIPLSGDFRPFFTIHDADHAAFVNTRPPQAGLLLGVTNPFFERACEHWPHVLSLGRSPSARQQHSDKSGIVIGPTPGWKSTHRRYTSRDHALLKQLEQACKGSDHAKRLGSEALRQHFTTRTTALLVPLQRYLQSLIPTPSESRSNLTNAGRLKPFSDAAFFASLKKHGSPLPFKSKAKQREFYERWLRTPAFGLWLARQEEVVQGVLRGMV